MNNFAEIIGWITLSFILLKALLKLIETLLARRRIDPSGRWILVTGCDSGIGALLVKSLVSSGVRVIAFTYTENGAKEAKNAGAEMAPCLDLTDTTALNSAVDEVLMATQGSLWGVVHNAGMAKPGFIEFQPIDNFREVMDVNFFAQTALTRLLIPAIKRGGGRFVFVTSVDGIVSLPGNAPYDAAKFAAEAYADALRTELAPWSIPVSVINPATMKTALSSNFFESMRNTWDSMHSTDPNGEWNKAWTEDWLNSYIEINNERLTKIAQDPMHAVKAIEHALTARKPRLRYLAGTMAKTLFYALWKLPEEVSFRFKAGIVHPRPEKS